MRQLLDEIVLPKTDERGREYVAIAPAMARFGLDVREQYQSIKAHPLLSAELKFVNGFACLPAELYYGWLFCLESEDPALAAFQKECIETINRSDIKLPLEVCKAS